MCSTDAFFSSRFSERVYEQSYTRSAFLDPHTQFNHKPHHYHHNHHHYHHKPHHYHHNHHRYHHNYHRYDLKSVGNDGKTSEPSSVPITPRGLLHINGDDEDINMASVELGEVLADGPMVHLIMVYVFFSSLFKSVIDAGMVYKLKCFMSLH